MIVGIRKLIGLYWNPRVVRVEVDTTLLRGRTVPELGIERLCAPAFVLCAVLVLFPELEGFVVPGVLPVPEGLPAEGCVAAGFEAGAGYARVPVPPPDDL